MREDVTQELEAEARRRAMSGSDVMLIFMLKSLRPDVYRERQDVTNQVSGKLEISCAGACLDSRFRHGAWADRRLSRRGPGETWSGPASPGAEGRRTSGPSLCGR